jgi:GTP-binding protein EngB required for normal cell division
MTSTLNTFEAQKSKALDVLELLARFIDEGMDLGVQIHPDLIQKLDKARQDIEGEKLKIALIGGFSEGKTSIAAAWLEELDKKSMNISQQESSSEVAVYNFKDKIQIIDTPGLFGFKEKMNASTAEIEKYKDITKRYVSEAHLVLYVMNSANPIKESHSEDLKWLFKTLGLLPRTVFVLSRFDEVADVEDEVDFQEKYAVKKASVLQRLGDVLALTPQEVQSVSLVAVAANPFDLGISHWLANLSEFRKISRVGELQRATTSKMEVNGGTLALANETKKTIIADVITKQLPAAEQAYAALHREAQRITEIKNNQLRELDNVARDIQNARIKLRGRILRYFEDLQLQMRNVGMETFDALMHREVGGEGCLIEQRIQEIFNDEVQSISSDLHRVRLDVNTEIQHFESLVGSMSKQGLKVLSQPGLINNKTVLIARDGVVAAAKTVGLDLGKMLKFKPWGAHNLAKGLGTGLAAVGLVMEAWDSYKEMERRDLFAKAIEQMISDLKQQANEIIGLIDGPDFQTKFFPTLAELQVQLNEISAEMTRVESQHTRFKHWYDSGKAIDVAFREIRTPEIAG